MNHWHIAVYEGEPTPRRVAVRRHDAAEREARIEVHPPIEGSYTYPKRKVEIVGCDKNCLGPEPQSKPVVV